MKHDVMHGILFCLLDGVGWKDAEAIGAEFPEEGFDVELFMKELAFAVKAGYIFGSTRRSLKPLDATPIYLISDSGKAFINSIIRQRLGLREVKPRNGLSAS